MLARISSIIALRRSQKCIKKGKIVKGITVLQRTVNKIPNNPHLFLHLGCALAKNNQLDEAKICLEKAKKIDSKNPIYSLFTGKILVDANHNEEAIQHLQESLNLDNSNQLTWSYMALANLATGNIQKFNSILDSKGITENQELQIRLILLLEKTLRKWNDHESPGNTTD